MPNPTIKKPKTYIVEHLDPELEAWSALEYGAIARESHAAGSAFVLSGVHAETPIPPELAAAPDLTIEQRSVEDLYPAGDGDGDGDGRPRRSAVCLLDPAAARELAPEDAERFDAFLFGGILGS
jgi:ribosome biogenesis SPOUT family RNA methylase Rps3